MALAKTVEGQRAFKERSALLSSRQRSAFILFDGVKSVRQVLAASAGLGMTQADVDQMVANGFLSENAAPLPVVGAVAGGPVSAPPFVTTPASQSAQQPAQAPQAELSKQQRFAQAWPMATQLTASLGIFGFRLNLSVESASGYDDLLALFPKIQAAVGADKAAALERVLKG